MRPLVLCSLLLVPSVAAQEEPSPPNIVFFLVDDLGWTDLGCYGSSFYETPHIDALAEQSVRFTAGYAACPVCSPTRASILTGKHPARLGVTDYISPNRGNQPEKWRRNTLLLPASYVDRMALEEVTLAEALREAGYATFFAGKWHLGPEGFWPEDQGFDVNRGGCHLGGPYGGKKYFSPYRNPRLQEGPPGEHLPDRLASETLAFIEESSHRPFFCYLSFYSVHTPLMARQDLEKKYLKKRQSQATEAPIWGQEGQRKLRLVQEHAVYAGMVEAVDLAVGRVCSGLRRLGLADNTVIVFTSDNGGLSTSEGHPTSNLPLRAGKGWLYEGGIREPLLIRWPKVAGDGRVCDQPVQSVDFYPTLLEIAGLPARPRQHADGVSLVPLLRGRSMRRGPLFWHYPHYGNQGGSPGAAIRDGAYKLIEFFEDDRVELYRMDEDGSESRDLAAQLPDKVRQLRRSLDAWQESLEVQFPAGNPNFSEAKK
jgi:arylsulfatase A-like enzyme